MKVHSLGLENFMLHRKFKRVFGDKEVIGIIAEYVDNPIRSNKGGKSQIVEAIRWVLTGQSRAKKDAELISWGADQMMVTLVLDDDGKKIKIRRGRDVKGNGILEINGIEKKAEAQDEINNLIGIKPDEFDLTCFFKQGDINQFMELGAADKKKHLMRWLKNDHWFKLERSVLDDLNTKIKRISELKAKASALEFQIEDVDLIKKELAASTKEFSTLQIERDRLFKKVTTYKASYKEQVGLRNRLGVINLEIPKLTKRIFDKNDDVNDLKNAESTLKRIKNKIEPVSLETEKKLRKEWAALQVKLESYKSTPKNKLTGTCPILGEPCDRIKPNKKKIEASRQEECAAQTRLGKLDSKIRALDAQKELLDRSRKLQDSVSYLRDRTSGLAALDAALERLRLERAEIKDTLDGYRSGNDLKLAELELDLSERRELLTSIAESIGQLQQRLKSNNQAQHKIIKIQKLTSKLERKISALRYVAFMFGKNGIPSQEIENAFDEVEDEMNFVLSRLGTNLQVEFQADREVDQWEDACHVCGWVYPKGKRIRECGSCHEGRIKKRKDELQLKVIEDGEDGAFHMESGGGKTMVSIATRIATTRLQQRQTGSNFNVVFLDEPDAALDPVAKQGFVKLITTTLIQKFGFQQIFWITHDKTIQESVPNVLKVIRHGKQSKTVWM